MSKPVEALINVLRKINPEIGKAIVMFEVGIPLIVEQKFSQDEVLNALEWLQSEGVIELLDGSRLKLVTPLE